MQKKENTINSKPGLQQMIRDWSLSLEKLRQENIVLKNRLSAVVQQQVSRPFLEEAEFFHQKFIDKDQMIDLLRHDIAVLLVKIAKGNAIGDLQVRLDLLEKDIGLFVSGFQQMQTSFARSLSEHGV